MAKRTAKQIAATKATVHHPKKKRHGKKKRAKRAKKVHHKHAHKKVHHHKKAHHKKRAHVHHAAPKHHKKAHRKGHRKAHHKEKVVTAKHLLPRRKMQTWVCAAPVRTGCGGGGRGGHVLGDLSKNRAIRLR